LYYLVGDAICPISIQKRNLEERQINIPFKEEKDWLEHFQKERDHWTTFFFSFAVLMLAIVQIADITKTTSIKDNEMVDVYPNSIIIMMHICIAACFVALLVIVLNWIVYGNVISTLSRGYQLSASFKKNSHWLGTVWMGILVTITVIVSWDYIVYAKLTGFIIWTVILTITTCSIITLFNRFELTIRQHGNIRKSVMPHKSMLKPKSIFYSKQKNAMKYSDMQSIRIGENYLR
jgi:magnesium-transporting ATPase (P-type)